MAIDAKPMATAMLAQAPMRRTLMLFVIRPSLILSLSEAVQRTAIP
jgi:hypothetical protein